MSHKPLYARTMIMVLAALLLFTGVALAENRVTVTCPVVQPVINGDSIGIPIHISNDAQLGGLSLGFYYNSNDVEITSVNPTNTIGANTAFFQYKFVPADNKLLVGWIDFTGVLPIQPQQGGLAFTLWMRVPLGTPAQCVNLDSAWVAPAGRWIFSPKTGGTLVPAYTDCGTGDILLGLSECPTPNNRPVAQCQNVTVNADANCVANASIDNGSYDPDNIPPGTDPITLTQRPTGPYSLGVTNVWLVVEDSHQAKDSCQATVTVQDVTKPVVTCPANIAKNNDPGQCGAVANFTVTATDNCSGLSIISNPASGSLFPVGVTTVWSIATDASNNKDSCSFTVTVTDAEAPVVTCPGNITKGNDLGQCGAIVNFTATATDNCPGVTVSTDSASGSFFQLGTAQVMAIATDAAGHKDTCFFNVTVNDTEKPKVTCPKDTVIVVAQGETGKNVDFTVTATDNCPGVSVVSAPPSGSFFPLGVTVVVSTATDAVGNWDSCTFSVQISTSLNPDFTISATPDTLHAMQGVATPFSYDVALGSIDGFSGDVMLSNSALPAGVTASFGANPVSVPGATTFAGTTGVNTPEGTYQVSIIGSEVVKQGHVHSDTVYLVVDPCSVFPLPAVSQSDFSHTITEGDSIADDNVFVTDTAICGSLSWIATSDQSWVTPDPTSGSVMVGEIPGSPLALKYNTASLTPGIYTGHVMVDDAILEVNQGNISQAVITINLTVNPGLVSHDSVIVGNEIVCPGAPVAVPVVFKNDEALAGMSTGLHWNCADLYLDSVTYHGSRVEYISAKFATINNTNRTLALGVLRIPPEPLVAPGRGLWATMWFTANVEAQCPQLCEIDSQFIAPGVEVLFNDEQAHSIYPDFVKGSVQINCCGNCISGTVVDENHDPIDGATVELYDQVPPGPNPIDVITSGPNGFYKVCLPPTKGATVRYSLRAFKPGYYASVREAAMESENVTIMLKPNGGTVTPTWEWVNLYCGGDATFDGAPLKVGSVLEAYDPAGNLCGQWTVSTPGTFGFMPVYRDDPYTPSIDEGCIPGNIITLKVDGFVVTPFGGPLHWGTNGDRYAACFEGFSEVCIVLKEGWNLISWNLDTPNDNIEVLAADVMDNVDVILSFEAGAQTYDPLLPEFSTLEIADHFHGFWFRMFNEDTLCLTGTKVPAATPINLEQNWNLVSYLPDVPYDVPTALASIWDKVIVVLGFDNGAQTYDPTNPGASTLPEMKTFFGYWIKTTAACDLIYPDGEPNFVNAPPDNTGTKASFVPRVAQSNTWVNLYGSNVKLNGQSLAVGSTIEAYNSNGALVGESTARAAGKFGFMPVYGTDNLSGDVIGKSAGTKITLKVNGEVVDQQITWTENGDRIRVSELTTAGKGGTLPNAFTLNQNYPNPFNPETTIDYVIGKSGLVELGVYNVLGNKIKTLVNTYQAEGNYSVKWYGDADNGDRVASGVYFYKLNTGDYTDIKKMTLLK